MLAPLIMPLSFATVIHLGAGKGDNVEQFRVQGARRIILLEPAADAANSLEHMTAGWENTRVINAAASSRNGQAELRLWNLPGLNSLAPVTPQMNELYPGLRQRSQQSVRLLSPRALLAEIGEIERPLLLVIKTPGTEMDVLTGWKADGLLEQVDQIELHCAEEILYEGATTRAELEAWLTDEHFVLTTRDSDDPDWPVLHLRADPAARALQRAQAAIAEHMETIARQVKALASRDAEFAKAAERADALEKSLAETKAEGEKQAKSLASRDADLKKAAERAESLEKSLAETKAEAEKQAKTVAPRDADLKRAVERTEALEKSLARVREENALLNDDLQRSALDQRSLRQDLGLAIRMQERLDVDLRDLQSRYTRLLAAKQEQDELLKQLTPRLQQAARELQIISHDDQRSAPTIAADGPSRTNEKPGASKEPRRKATGQGRKSR